MTRPYRTARRRSGDIPAPLAQVVLLGLVGSSLLCEARGVPIGLAHDGADRHDVKLLAATLDWIPVPRPKPTSRRPQRLCLDRGYDYRSVRELIAARDYSPHIRSRGEVSASLPRRMTLCGAGTQGQ